jgi:hypothetical protein
MDNIPLQHQGNIAKLAASSVGFTSLPTAGCPLVGIKFIDKKTKKLLLSQLKTLRPTQIV